MPRGQNSGPGGGRNAEGGAQCSYRRFSAGKRLGFARRWRAACRLAIAIPVIFLSVAAIAAEPIPSSVDPGQIDKRLRERPRLREREGPEIQRPEFAPGVAPKAEVSFVLNDVKIEGATVYAPAEFKPLYQDLLGHEVRLSDIAAVAKKITERYQADGYVLSKAVAGEGNPADGIATIRAIEGYIGKVSIEGEVEGDKDLLTDYGDKIAADRPTRTSNLERYVLLISDLPGVTVRPFLEPVDLGSGEYKLILAMQQRSIAASAQIDNRGSNFVGPYELWLGGAFNSMFGLYETTHLQFVTTPDTGELVFGGGSYSQPIGSDGMTATIDGSYNADAPGFTLAPIDIHSHALSGDIQVAYPLIRSRHLDLYTTGRFSYRDSVSDHASVRAFDDRLRVIRAGTVVSFDDGISGRDSLSAEVSQGLDILGATKSNSLAVSSPGADAGFEKVTIDFSRYQRIEDNWGVCSHSGNSRMLAKNTA